jgi:hypothetical protein
MTGGKDLHWQTMKVVALLLLTSRPLLAARRQDQLMVEAVQGQQQVNRSFTSSRALLLQPAPVRLVCSPAAAPGGQPMPWWRQLTRRQAVMQAAGRQAVVAPWVLAQLMHLESTPALSPTLAAALIVKATSSTLKVAPTPAVAQSVTLPLAVMASTPAVASSV